jgi:Uma2 family endonuclease
VANPELRIKLRADWYPLPDICVFIQPDPQERYPERPPLLWIEILSEEDKMVDVGARLPN